MFDNKKNELTKTKLHNRYFQCPKCGYVSIIKDTDCPVCSKKGLKIKMT